jgi:hypothetical protein
MPRGTARPFSLDVRSEPYRSHLRASLICDIRVVFVRIACLLRTMQNRFLPGDKLLNPGPVGSVRYPEFPLHDGRCSCERSSASVCDFFGTLASNVHQNQQTEMNSEGRATQGTRVMPIYRFRILGGSDQVIAGQYSHCKDDDAARRHADILATRNRNSNIVIWDYDRQVPREYPAPLPDKAAE